MTPTELLAHHRQELARCRERAAELAGAGVWREAQEAAVAVALAEAALRAAEEMLEACGPTPPADPAAARAAPTP